MQNKERLWILDEEWNFKTKDDLIYIENIGEFVKKKHNVKMQQEYANLILFQIRLKNGN